LVLTSVTPASSAPVLQTPKATSSTLYFDSLTVNAGNGGFLHCIQMDTSVNAANQVVSVGADIAFDADPKFFACLVRFRSEERRVGKECRSLWPRNQYKKRLPVPRAGARQPQRPARVGAHHLREAMTPLPPSSTRGLI